MTDDFQAEFDLYRNMERQAINLWYQTNEYFQNSDYENAERSGIGYLYLIQNLPRSPINTSYRSMIEKSYPDLDMVVCTAYVFRRLISIYTREGRMVEALVCLQKLHYIVTNYQAYTSDYIDLKLYLDNELENLAWAKVYTLENNRFEIINESFFRQIFSNINAVNYEKLKNYNPYLLQERIFSSRSSGGCFIATAAYSTSAHPDLDTFRNFRDEKLLTHPVGKRLVSLYYRLSPSIAQYVEKMPVIKNFLRWQLGRLAQWMREQSVKC